MKKSVVNGQQTRRQAQTVAASGSDQWLRESTVETHYGNRATAFLKQHSLALGIGLMFLLTWPIDLANAGVLPLSVPFAVYILLGYGFVIASIAMTWMTQGSASVVVLLKRFLIWRVRWPWYLMALLLLPAIDSLSILLYAGLSQTAPDFSTVYAYRIFGESANLLLLIVPYFLFDALTNGEEIGWRGYVLPRLQAKYSPLMASLLLGIVWAVWHLPKFVTHWDSAYIALWAVQTLGLAVLYTWLYGNTRGSLLLVTLFHASSNTSGILLPVDSAVVSQNLGVHAIIALLTLLAAGAATAAAGREFWTAPSRRIRSRQS